ncbi:MAG: rod shape-determining protein MreC [Bacteroidota bacterium]
MFIAFEAIALIMLVNNNVYQRSVFVTSANNMAGNLYSFSSDLTDYFNLQTINKQLADENAILYSLSKNSFIKTIQQNFIYEDTVYRLQYRYIDAKVINNTVTKRNNYIMLNKGFKQGVAKDMAVVSPEGIVGTVKEVSENFSTVLSVLHSESKVSAKIKRLGYIGTLVWPGNDYKTGLLKDIPFHIQVRTGDTIVSSGYSYTFPEGVMIGRVKDIKTNPGDNFFSIVVNFSVDYNKLGYVYIINNLMQKEQLNLEKLTQKNDKGIN